MKILSGGEATRGALRRPREFAVAVIVVLVVLLLAAPAYQRVVRPVRQTHCMANFKKLSVALELYLNDTNAFPPRLDDLYRARYLEEIGDFICPLDIDDRGYVGKHRKVTLKKFPKDRMPRLSYVYDEKVSSAGPDSSVIGTLMNDAQIGVVACPCHGDCIQHSVHSTVYSGLVFRLRPDGSVIRVSVDLKPGEWSPAKLLGLSPSPPAPDRGRAAVGTLRQSGFRTRASSRRLNPNLLISSHAETPLWKMCGLQ